MGIFRLKGATNTSRLKGATPDALKGAVTTGSAVGASVQLVWHTSTTLGDTLQIVWDVQVVQVAVAAPTTALFNDEGAQSATFAATIAHGALFAGEGCQTGYFSEITGAVDENQLVYAGNRAPFT